jgi:hypothetical protein
MECAMAYVTGPRDLTVVLSLAALLLLAVPHTSGADLWKVDFTKHWTGHERGLQYQYTFKVTSPDGAPVDGAEFTVVGDMPDMRNHHPTQSVVAAPGVEAGTYNATLHFFMEGKWELKLNFEKPFRNELLLLDTVRVANKAD